MKNTIKDIISLLLICIAKIFTKKGIPVLEYHRVSISITSEDVHSIFPDEFEKQIKYLTNKGYKFISLNEMFELISTKKKLGKYVVITFDDGHLDVKRYAYPILKKYHAKATVFVVSECVGKSGWLSKDGDLLPDKTEKSQRWELLTWEDLDQISDCFFIEAHCATHKKLDTLNKDEITYQVSEPKQKIKEKTGNNVNFFCYPYGRYNDTVIECLRSNQYIGACTEHKGVNSFNQDRFKLRRNEVGRGISISQFRLLLDNGIKVYAIILNALYKILRKNYRIK